MNLKIKNKLSLVIGAGSVSSRDISIKGIGTAIVESLAKEGVQVDFTYNKSKNGAQELAKRIKKITPLPPTFFKLDISKDFNIESMVKGRIPDILIINAGTRTYSKNPSKDDIENTLKVNYFSVKSIVDKLSNLMSKSGKDGKIIIISSFLAGKSHKYLQTYCDSKKLINDYVLEMVPILAKKNISIVSVCHGFTKTPMTEERLDLYEKMARSREIPSGKVISSQEIADIITFLSSPLALQINGLVYCDGGARYNLD